MEHDKPGSDDPSGADLDTLDDANEANAKSVTDLIDRIERTAFQRYVSIREHRRKYSWSLEDRPEH